MAPRIRRKNESRLGWLRAIGISAFTWFGLSGMNVRPVWLAPVLGMVSGALMLASADLGVLASVIFLSIPVIAVAPLPGMAMLVLGIAAARYLSTDHGGVFLIIAAAVAGAYVGPVWAAAALAGYLLGASEGALAAALACITVEVIGLTTGEAGIGVTLTGGTQALIGFADAPANLLAAGWIANTFAGLNAGSVTELISGVSRVAQPLALLIQPAAWAGAAVVAGMAKSAPENVRNEIARLAVVAAAVLVAAAGTVGAFTLAGSPIPWTGWAWATASSVIVAVGFVAVGERAFPQLVSTPNRKVSMASEDADVDELLRLIATAEDKLAAQHTSQRVVLITDMKSFSRMTEEDGSVATAKAIQRHRDLLLPVVSAHGGHGKSTGGDGLVAAFESAADALSAAAGMQVALAEHNTAHSNEREIWVRAGLASGEVVLDNGGRPFIGAGLNLAARIMNLADGGQILAAGDVASAAQSAGVDVHFFGQVELKNIAKPVEIAEVLWSGDQTPRDPRNAIAVGE